MAKRVVTVQLEKGPGKGNFACFMVDDMPWGGLAGAGRTAREAMADIAVARDEMREILAEKGKEMDDLEFSFRFDIGSLFDYYSYLNIEGFAKRLGISPTVMRQYATSKRNPSQARIDQIQKGLSEIASEMQSIAVAKSY